MMNFFNYYSTAFESSILNVFGEQIDYHFGGGGVRKIRAVVERNRMAEDSNGIPMRVMSITVTSNRSNGILLSEIDVDDTILLQKNVGEEPEFVSIMETEDDGSGVITLYCR